MRIIGGKDYYDGVARLGQDPSIVFVRHKDKQILESKLIPPAYHIQPRFTKKNSKKNQFFMIDGKIVEFHGITLWFCGQKFSGIEAICYEPILHKVFWSLEEFQKFTERYGYILNESKYSFVKISNHFKRDVPDTCLNWLIDNRITIAKWQHVASHTGYWKIDGFDLSYVEFFRIKDPNTAFQEISMWVGGTIAQPMPSMIAISEEDKAAKAGFDKWSFRKPGKNSNYQE